MAFLCRCHAGVPAQYLLSSPKYLSGSLPALSKFLEVYLAVCRDINATNGTWAPQLIQSVSTAMNSAPETILAEGGVPYYDPNGAVNTDSLTSVQNFWVHARTKAVCGNVIARSSGFK
jgi:hypothetical protein